MCLRLVFHEKRVLAVLFSQNSCLGVVKQAYSLLTLTTPTFSFMNACCLFKLLTSLVQPVTAYQYFLPPPAVSLCSKTTAVFLTDLPAFCPFLAQLAAKQSVVFGVQTCHHLSVLCLLRRSLTSSAYTMLPDLQYCGEPVREWNKKTPLHKRDLYVKVRSLRSTLF